MAVAGMKGEFKEKYDTHWKPRLTKNCRQENECILPNEIFESVEAILKGGKTCLDAGCGNGAAIEILKPKFDEVCGCDISKTALEVAKIKGVLATCVDLNSKLLPYQDDSFDSVTCLEVIEHVLDPVSLLKDFWRVLKFQGQLILTTPNIRYFRNLATLILKGKFPHTTIDSFIWGGGHLHYFTRNDLEFLLQSADFKKIKFHINHEQFLRSWKRRAIHGLTGESFFGEWFCGGIIVEAFKK